MYIEFLYISCISVIMHAAGADEVKTYYNK